MRRAIECTNLTAQRLKEEERACALDELSVAWQSTFTQQYCPMRWFAAAMSNEWAHSIVNDFIMTDSQCRMEYWNMWRLEFVTSKQVKWNKTCRLIQIVREKKVSTNHKVELLIFLQDFIRANWVLLLRLSPKVLYA